MGWYVIGGTLRSFLSHTKLSNFLNLGIENILCEGLGKCMFESELLEPIIFEESIPGVLYTFKKMKFLKKKSLMNNLMSYKMQADEECSVCGAKYTDYNLANICEQAPPVQGTKPKIGDIIMILHGDFAGERMRVTNVWITRASHEGRELPPHIIECSGKLIDSWGNTCIYYPNFRIIE